MKLKSLPAPLNIKTLSLFALSISFSISFLSFQGCTTTVESTFDNLNIAESVNHIGKQLKSQHEINPKAQADISKAVRSTYNQYVSALNKNSGSRASKLVTQSTIDYFNKMKRVALTGASRQVKNLSIIDKTIVLFTRQTVSKSRLSSMSGTDFFEHAISSGWINSPNSALGFISFDGQNAYAHISPDGKPGPQRINFFSEGGKWKIDATSLYEIQELELRQLATSYGSENQYVFSIIAASTGRRPSSGIWSPTSYR